MFLKIKYLKLMGLIMIYISKSINDTSNIADKFAAGIVSGDVICLYGDLGVGKTVFVQALAKRLGVGEYVNSPTFNIVNEYNGKNFTVYHFDAYRIEDYEQIFDVGYDEYVYSDAVSIIEWANNIEPVLPQNRYDVFISKDISQGEDYRKIVIEKRGDK